MAGLSGRARAAGGELPDRISIEVLARTFTNELLDAAIDEAGVREIRFRLLPARLMLFFTLACWLFTGSGYRPVMAKLADARAAAGPGWDGWELPTTGPISRARARLGAEPVRRLFTRVAGPVGTPATPGVFHLGLRVVSADSFTLEVPATSENEEFFRRGGGTSGAPAPCPLRALVLAESGTGALIGGTHGPGRAGGLELMAELLPWLGPGTLVLASGDAASWRPWRDAAATGAQLCWRMPSSSVAETGPPLADGSRLGEPRPPGPRDAAPIAVRVIAYPGPPLQPSCLVTTLLDAETAPAAGLARLFGHRWRAGTGMAGLIGTRSGGPGVLLRSRSPAAVAQEFWALLCVYQALRDMLGMPPAQEPSLKAAARMRAVIDAAAPPHPLDGKNWGPP